MRFKAKESEDLHSKGNLNNNRLRIFEPKTAIP